MTVRIRFTLLLLAIGVSAAACGSTGGDGRAAGGFEVVREASIQLGDPIPPPDGVVVLTIRGAVSNTNVDDHVELDMETLEALGTVTYEVLDDQAEGGEVRFEGVLLERLLEVVGADDSATTLVTAALNDYSVDIPVDDATESPVLVATRAHGDRMPVEQFGPLRVVYPYGSHDLDRVEHDPRWIWQLASIEVR
jgi:hypothetical protein